jgi:hypothetical protein
MNNEYLISNQYNRPDLNTNISLRCSFRRSFKINGLQIGRCSAADQKAIESMPTSGWVSRLPKIAENLIGTMKTE